MKFNFVNIDEQTRKLMLDEINTDINKGELYYSKRFNDVGIRLYADILKQAVELGDEEYLGNSLKQNGCFKEKEERQTKLVKVPETAHKTFAESEFNRFYIRALCIRAIANGQQLFIYRARPSDNPRIESERIIDTIVNPKALLTDLRKNLGVDTSLGLPPGLNSGLTVKLI